MAYSIEVRETPVQPVMYIGVTTLQSEIGPTLMTILPEVFRYVREQGGKPAGPPIVRYTAWRQDDCDLQGGMPVVEAVAATDRVQSGTLGGGKAAFTLHVGPYSRLREAHQAVMTWIEENGKTIGGDPWESYVNDPTEHPEEEWKTEIYWPLK